ncbi:MAG: amidohydrolase family protein [Corynebacterium sp.]|nr:amidohydrolase family protein [Corynebacterium sp.]
MIDLHAHLVPEFYAAALRGIGMSNPDGSPLPAWDSDTHLKSMAGMGIDKAYLSLSSPGIAFFENPAAWAQEINSYGAGLVKDNPEHFGFFATLPLPDVDAAVREASEILKNPHVAGIGLLTNYKGLYLGDAAMDPLFEILNAAGVVVFIHPTSPAGVHHVDCGRAAPLVEYLFDTTRAVTNMILNHVTLRYPHIKWVVPHNGALLPGVVDRVALFSKNILGDTELDVVEALQSMYFEIGSSAPFPRTADYIQNLVPGSQLVAGTDYPYAPPPAIAANAQRIQALPIAEQLQKNTLTLFQK